MQFRIGQLNYQYSYARAVGLDWIRLRDYGDGRRRVIATETRGRPWPREREGPTSEAQWEGCAEGEGSRGDNSPL